MNRFFVAVLAISFLWNGILAEDSKFIVKRPISYCPPKGIKVYKFQLKNGMSILVVPMRYIPKVVVQLWYNVGSRHEVSGQKGSAHLLEHMIFKGTSRLSESDISAITTKLSGYCSAFASYDYTKYIFEFPSQHWRYALDLLADCMCNCTFKPDLLNLELKAIVQELKMYRDDYEDILIDELMSCIFKGHPYYYPIIGYKKDLCKITTVYLRDFYAKYYAPNNATLVVVGDVEPRQVYDQVKHYFAGIRAKPVNDKQIIHWERDFAAKTVTLYRDVRAPTMMCAFVVPGLRAKKGYVLELLSWLIASGPGSRLYKKLVEQFNIATSVDSFCYDLFDYGLLLIQVQPRSLRDIHEIVRQVKNEISNLRCYGIKPAELERARAKEYVSYLSLFEDHQGLANAIGKSYLATNDEQYIFNYGIMPDKQLHADINSILEQWLHPKLMHIGCILPLSENDKNFWRFLQNQSDEFDRTLLVGKERETPLEKSSYASQIMSSDFTVFKFPHYSLFMLSNGLEILYYRDQRIPKVNCILEFKANYWYDPNDKQGLSNFASQLLLKGTSKYSAIELAEKLGVKGIGVSVSSGALNLECLKRDFPFALEMVEQVLVDSIFEPSCIEQVRNKIDADLAQYWDKPYQFVDYIVKRNIYGGSHPYGKNVIGTLKSLHAITRRDLVNYYKSYITPYGARLAVVGDFDEDKLKQLLENTIGHWQGPCVADLNFPALSPPPACKVTQQINRDQVVFAVAGLSVGRKDLDYDKLLLFDQGFGGGVLDSMNSLLFKIREQTGLFYTIFGSVLVGVDKQPGVVSVKTMVSLDRLVEAELAIKHAIETAVEQIDEQSLSEARDAVINSLVDYFASYEQIARAFLSLRRFDLAPDYFDTRAQQLSKIDLPSVKQAAKRVLDINAMITVKIGRVTQANKT